MSSNVSVVGRLVRDPELREVGEKKTPNCKLSIAFDEGFGDNKKSVFLDVEAWQGIATNTAKYTKKGSKVFVTGHLKQDNWEKDGVKFSKICLNADKVEFLDSAPKTKEVDTEDEPTENIPF